MTKFVQGSELNAALESLIKHADEILFLVSPFIKLHNRIKDQLKLKQDNPTLKIYVLYGSFDNTANRIGDEDLVFLKQFPNIEIRYEENLNAKYYGSEKAGLITSMNLYDFSQNNNIEVGVFTESSNKLIDEISDLMGSGDLDVDAHQYFLDVIKNSELLYHNVPEFEKGMFGLQGKYLKSTVQKDIIGQYHNVLPDQQDVASDHFVGFKSFEKKQPNNGGGTISEK